MPTFADSALLAARIGAVACVAPALATAQSGPPPQARNVLIVMSDQHNVHALGCYGGGFGGLSQPLTPNLDQLAAEGVRFENAYCSSPQCCPSRYTVLTGRWPHVHGLRENGVWEPRGISTLPELARAAGYATATVGKHHMQWLDQPAPLFEDHGFERVVDIDDYYAHCAAHDAPPWNAGGNRWAMPGLPQKLAGTGYTFNANELHPDGYFTDEVLRFLDERAGPQGDGRPFVCWYLPLGPHTPVLPSGPSDPHDWAHRHHPFEALELPPNVDKRATTERLAQLQAHFAGVTDEQWREVLSYYYGLISQIDWNIGRVLDRLAELGLADETLVVYTADHGEMAAEMGCWTKGGGTQEAITRVPLILRLPGVLPAGRVARRAVRRVRLQAGRARAHGALQAGEVRARRAPGAVRRRALRPARGPLGAHRPLGLPADRERVRPAASAARGLVERRGRARALLHLERGRARRAACGCNGPQATAPSCTRCTSARASRSRTSRPPRSPGTT